MAKPIILSIDDEIQVLNAIVRDLQGQFGSKYRIMKATSGTEALDTLRQLKLRNSPVALLLADQRMPEMEGTEFLTQAVELYPEARKVLLTAYADTEAAIRSINEIGLDHYLMKPWDPPEQNLFPVLEDLLSDWLATVPVPYDGIRIAGTLWSPQSHNIKDFLARNRIPYQWLDLEEDPQTQTLVDSVIEGDTRLPVVFFPDGSTLIQPDFRALAEKVGLQTEANHPYYDLIIIGAGPAGLGAAVYGASEGLSTALIEREATGGQAGTSSLIENYLGFPKGISGTDLARRATDQAKRLGAEILTAVEVVNVRVEDNYRVITLNDGTELSCKVLIIASGVTVRKLDQPGVERLTGAGIYYGAALSEAAFYKDKPVYVIGGANSAGQAAMFFSRFAKDVTMLVRGTSLSKSMSQYLINQINETENIHVKTNTVVTEAIGEEKLEAIRIKDHVSDEEQEVPAAAMFIFIGAKSHSNMVADVVDLNSAGFVRAGRTLMRNGKRPKGWSLQRDPYPLEPSVPGIFVAGDVRDEAVRRVASAVGEGANAVSQVHQYLKSV
ncbi:MAG: fused response regulator/thioredoxin-disulfide reductase [Chloroflexota bacterium]|nr:MAG: fused response regulator/thioredoxin-disulfide reductase [Chloroflexota bacterium]